MIHSMLNSMLCFFCEHILIVINFTCGKQIIEQEKNYCVMLIKSSCGDACESLCTMMQMHSLPCGFVSARSGQKTLRQINMLTTTKV